jgi:hypothetical protein
LVSARMAGTGQITILEEQPMTSSKAQSGARRDRRNRQILIRAILSYDTFSGRP